MKRKPALAKPVRKLTKPKSYEFGDATLKIITDPDEKREESRSLVYALVKALARGEPLSGKPWDAKLVQEAAKEILVVLGEDERFGDSR